MRSRYERFGTLGEFDRELVRWAVFARRVTSLPRVGAGGDSDVLLLEE